MDFYLPRPPEFSTVHRKATEQSEFITFASNVLITAIMNKIEGSLIKFADWIVPIRICVNNPKISGILHSGGGKFH